MTRPMPGTGTGEGTRFRAGEAILLIEERRGKRHLVILHAGRAFHSDRGFIGHDALIGALEGATVRTSLSNVKLDNNRNGLFVYSEHNSTGRNSVSMRHSLRSRILNWRVGCDKCH